MIERIYKANFSPSIVRISTVRSVASPEIMLKTVRTLNAVDAFRKANEKIYARGIIAQA